MGSLMQTTTTEKKAAILELQGARERLSRVLLEIQDYRGSHDDVAYCDLLREYDIASRAVMKAREEVDRV